MKNNLVLTIIIAVVVGAVAFFGGMKYQQMNGQSQNSAFGGLTGRQVTVPGIRNVRLGNGRSQIGQVITIDAANNSLVIKLADGSSKIVNLTSQTRVVKTQAVSLSDVQTGNEVAVFGTPNSDGSVTAADIQLNPGNGMRGGPNGPSGSSGPGGY